MKVDTHLDFGTVVYLKTDKEQDEFLVTGFIIRPHGILYIISYEGLERNVYDFEITTERRVFV